MRNEALENVLIVHTVLDWVRHTKGVDPKALRIYWISQRDVASNTLTETKLCKNTEG